MKPYFDITYRLKERDFDNPGNLKDFSLTKGLYTACIGASDKNEAISTLKSMFNMLTVEIVGISNEKTMTDEEYLNG